MRRFLPWALPAALLLEPIRSTLTYGQVNALLTCLATTNHNRRRPPASTVLALLTFAVAPHWLLPSGAGRELHWPWWQQATGDSYTLTGLAALTHAAVMHLPPRPRRREPRTSSRQTAPHDHGPVPSGTRDDASLPART